MDLPLPGLKDISPVKEGRNKPLWLEAAEDEKPLVAVKEQASRKKALALREGTLRIAM